MPAILDNFDRPPTAAFAISWRFGLGVFVSEPAGNQAPWAIPGVRHCFLKKVGVSGRRWFDLVQRPVFCGSTLRSKKEILTPRVSGETEALGPLLAL